MPFDSEIPVRSRDLIVLEKARERIARGWCQHVSQDRHGVCLVQALSYAHGYQRLSYEAGVFSERVCETLRVMGFDGELESPAPARWNDAPGRTQAEVLERFDAAIAKLEKSDGE